MEQPEIRNPIMPGQLSVSIFDAQKSEIGRPLRGRGRFHGAIFNSKRSARL
jgi:hypothetical protein